MAVTTFSPKNQLRKKDSYDPFINQAKDEAVQVEVSTFKEVNSVFFFNWFIADQFDL